MSAIASEGQIDATWLSFNSFIQAWCKMTSLGQQIILNDVIGKTTKDLLGEVSTEEVSDHNALPNAMFLNLFFDPRYPSLITEQFGGTLATFY